MHQLFSQVLGQRDLSRAGDLFSLEDAAIEDCLSQALDQIKSISCSPDYLTNDNDQAVVEICITRITTAIRETSSIERHSTALVGLWESCLEHNLTPQGDNTEDTPHTKIASDITSCILQNYSCPSVMVLAVPVAVRFLHRGNRELSRNMSSYLSLAAMVEIDLLAEHTEAITLSVLAGNHMLLRVLPSVYPRQPDIIHRHLGKLTAVMSQLDCAEQQHLIRLLQMVAEQHPLMLSPQVPALVSYLGNQSLIEAILGTLVDVSQASPSSLVSCLPKLRTAGQQWPALLGHVAKIHGAVGIISEAHAHHSLVYLVSLLGNMEHTFHHTLLLEIRALTDRYPSLLGGYGKDLYRLSNSFTAIARLLGKRLEESATSCRSENGHCSPSSNASLQREGGGTGGGGSEPRKPSEADVQEDSPAAQRRYSLNQALRDEQREMRFNRSKSLALHTVHSRSFNSDGEEDREEVELNPDITFTSTLPCQHSTEHREVTPPAKKLSDNAPTSAAAPAPDSGVKEQERTRSGQKNKDEEAQEVGVADKLFIHLRDNLEMIREFCKGMVQQIPIPAQCVIEAFVPIKECLHHTHVCNSISDSAFHH
ncbi:ventricular zone-expressed PH domain-containing protein isoform X3 [Festucalex cinctus]